MVLSLFVRHLARLIDVENKNLCVHVWPFKAIALAGLAAEMTLFAEYDREILEQTFAVALVPCSDVSRHNVTENVSSPP